MFQVTAFQAILKVAYGIDADLIHKEKLLTEKPLFKKGVESFGSIASSSYLEDLMWLLFYMKPQLNSIVMNLFSESFASTTKNTSNSKQHFGFNSILQFMAE